MREVSLPKVSTVSGRPPKFQHGEAGAPTDEKLADGQLADHWVLSQDERIKGYVRPYRESYRHVGSRPQYSTRDLTPEEQERYAGCGYVKYEPYPPDESVSTGRFWTAQQLASGCGASTRMPVACAETYARDPHFYGTTFCCQCGGYFRVGKHGEFVWDNGERVGT